VYSTTGCGTVPDNVRRVFVTRVGRNARASAEDAAAVEEPLEVRLHGRPFAIIMRTPGADRDLAAGFLFAEGVVSSADDLGAVEHCRHPDHPEHHNVVDVYLVEPAAHDVERQLEQRRRVMTTSSCGLCGRATIDSLRTRAERLPVELRISAAVAAQLPATLRTRQAGFDSTGGLHAAGLFTVEGDCEASAEDVGRHNAVDKVVGRMLLDERLPLRQLVLVVSGRTSFEIVQKAWLAGLELVCAVSAPSTLAIDVAEAAGITLLGFTRGGAFNIYSHPDRIVTV
jgi:FdhD protein